MKNICIFCSSSNAIDRSYFEKAKEIATALSKNEYNLVYGGGQIGLMGTVAKTFIENKRLVTGIIPDKLNIDGVKFDDIDKVIITESMSERKNMMTSMSDAFLALPGGFGTLEELLEIITLKQLGYINKPIAIYNINNFFDDLTALFDKLFIQNFTKAQYKELYHISSDIKSILDYLNDDNYSVDLNKWF